MEPKEVMCRQIKANRNVMLHAKVHVNEFKRKDLLKVTPYLIKKRLGLIKEIIRIGDAVPVFKKSFFLVLLFFITSLTYALPTDKKQVIQMTADSADLSQLHHKGVYTGNVIFVQGTTNLHATKAVTKGNQKNELTLAIAYGSKDKQAHYWTESGVNKPPFHAYADTIKYYPLKHLIELIGNAHVEQGPNSLSAAKIIYDIQQQHLVSQSDIKTQTVIILYPEKKAL